MLPKVESRRGAPRWIGIAGFFGGLCGLGLPGIFVAGSAVAALLVYTLPLQGFLVVLAAKPIIDCFWDVQVGMFWGGRLNLQSIVGIAVPLAIALVLQRAHAWPTRDPIWKLARAYALTLGIAMLISPARGPAIGDFLRIALPLLFLPLGLAVGSSSARFALASGILASYGFVPVLTALLELTGVITAKEGGVASLEGIVRVRGFYQHPLDIAMRCGMAFPFALMIASTTKSHLARFASRAWAGALALAAMVTLVRSAIAATFSQLIVLGWTGTRRVLAVFAVVLGIVLIGAFAPVQSIVRGALEPIQEGAGYRFASGRLLLFATQIAGFREASVQQKLIGRGLHTTPRVTLQYSPISEINPAAVDYEEGKVTAHNQLLRILTEGGIVGVLMFVGLIAKCFITISRTCRSSDPVRAQFARATLSVLVGAGVYSISATPFDQPSVTWPLWFAVGIACAKPRSATYPESITVQTSEP